MKNVKCGIRIFNYNYFRAVSSVGLEHHVDNVRVAGSSPAQPTKKFIVFSLKFAVASITIFLINAKYINCFEVNSNFLLIL